MNMNPKEYDAYVKQMGPKSPIWKDCFHAFWIGGLICVLGQLIQNGFAAAGLDKTDAGTATSMSLVVLSVLSHESVHSARLQFQLCVIQCFDAGKGFAHITHFQTVFRHERPP